MCCKYYRLLFILIVYFFSGFLSILLAENFALIINKKNDYNQSDFVKIQHKVKKIFLRKNKKWPNNVGKIKIYCRESGSMEQKAFNQVILKMPEMKIKKYWMIRRQRYGESPPQEIKSSRIAMRLVAKSKGAFSVVKESDLVHLPDGLRVLLMFSSTGHLYAYQKPISTPPKQVINIKIPAYKAVKLSLKYPKKGTKIQSKSIVVQGNIYGDWQKNTLKLNQKSIKIASNGTFKTKLNLNFGKNKLKLSVKSLSGKSIKLSRWVIRSMPLALVLDQKEILKVKKGQIMVSGNIQGLSETTKLSINGQDKSFNNKGHFNHLIKVKAEQTKISVIVQTDVNKIQKWLSLKKQVIPIILTIESPKNNIQTIESIFLLAAKVRGGNGKLKAFINKKPLKINNQGKFSDMVNIAMGINSFLIQVKDSNGQRRTKKIQIEGVKPKALNIILTQGNYLVSDQPYILVKGRIKGGRPAYILMIDGNQIKVTKKGYFSTKIAVQTGERSVIFKVTDKDNKTTSTLIKVIGE